MSLHKLQHVTIGVPAVAQTAAFYRDFGLTDTETPDTFATAGGDVQLQLVYSPIRRLVRLVVGVDDQDDLGRIAARADRASAPTRRTAEALHLTEPRTRIEVVARIAPRRGSGPDLAFPRAALNDGSGIDRIGQRAAVVDRSGPVQPLKLGHCVVGTPDPEPVTAFFRDIVGFKVSDVVRNAGTFMRCSTDHHNLLINPAPITFLHHTSWQVPDLDEIGRGAMRLLEQDPARHVWGLGRHCIGSNFFWYFRDPAGNFAEYYSDLDVIPDDAAWDPSVWEGDRGLYLWGPPPPPSFIRPDDLAELMIGSHS